MVCLLLVEKKLVSALLELPRELLLQRRREILLELLLGVPKVQLMD
jgi:hypothetical protein